MSNPNEELAPRFKNSKPLRERTKGIHTSEEEPNEVRKDNEEEPNEEEPAPTDARNEVRKDNNEEEQENEEEEQNEEEPAPTDNKEEEKRTLEEHRETNLNTNEIMENYNKIIDEFYKDNDAEKYFKRIQYLTIMLPESKFEEIAEEEAEKLSQMNFNGVKLFKDIAEARQFLHDLRYGRKNRFKGQNQKFYKLPKIQKIIKQSEQTKQIISPMMTRNIKPLTKTNYIYEY